MYRKGRFLQIWSHMVLNEVPDSNDATYEANNVCLSIMDAQQFSMAAMQLVSCRKVDLPEMRDNDTKAVKILEDENKLHPGKEWGLYAQQFI